MSNDVILDSGDLECPTCDGGNLHHYETRVINRFCEDGDGKTMAVSSHEVTIKTTQAHDIPHRRDCIEIDFWCESCVYEFESGNVDVMTSAKPGWAFTPITLRIYQHKGVTSFEWVSRNV